MKLTVEQLNAATAEQFADDPAVQGEVECFVVFASGRDKELSCASSLEKGAKRITIKPAGGEIPAGAGKGAKVRLSGITYVEHRSREGQGQWAGKTFRDAIYTAQVEVLQAGERRGGPPQGGSGGRWTPPDPAEETRKRASIERQSVLGFAGRLADTLLMLPDGHPLRLTEPAALEAAVERGFKLGCRLLKVAERPFMLTDTPPDTRPPAQEAAGGATATEQGADTRQAAKPQPAPAQAGQTAKPDPLAHLSVAGRRMAEEVRKWCLEMADGDPERARVILVALTRWTAQDGSDQPGISHVGAIRNEAQARAIIASIRPRYEFWQLLDVFLQGGYVALLSGAYASAEALRAALDEFQAANAPDPADKPPAFDGPIVGSFPMPDGDWQTLLELVQEATGAKDSATAEQALELAARKLFGTRYQANSQRRLTGRAGMAVVNYLRGQRA
ncbi:hypothetical protein FJY71_03500 [candidate division WOR-3 bacterium]|nr:hypothetical protein [candidate division WOR-3 bacterium]